MTVAVENSSIQVTGPDAALTTALFGQIEDALGELLTGRIEIRQATIAARSPLLVAENSPGKIPPNYYSLWAIDNTSRLLTVVEGRLPNTILPEQSDNPFQPPPLEVAIGAVAARETGWTIGDRLSSADGAIDFDIVGVIAPRNSRDEAWFGDLVPFNARVVPGTNMDTVYLSLWLPVQGMRTYFPAHQRTWRIPIDRTHVTVDNVETVAAGLNALRARIATTRVTISTDLPSILDRFRSQAATARMALLLLTLQALVFVLYTLGVITSLLLERTQAELATLAGRGASAAQVTRLFALQALLVAFPVAVVVGPAIAFAAFGVWAQISGSPPPDLIPDDSWQLALVAAGFGWLAMVIPVYPSARRSLLDWQRQVARPSQLAGWQKAYVDVFLLLLGGLAYWQLVETGSFAAETPAARAADPVLLLGPSLLLIAVTLVFLRVVPALLALVAWIVRQMRGLILPLSAARLARSPVGPSRVVLLISIAIGLTLFAKAFGDSLAMGQREQAHFAAGADLRVAQADAVAADFARRPGVVAASPVLRDRLHRSSGGALAMLALDPNTIDRVARFRGGGSGMRDVAATLASPSGSDALPAILPVDMRSAQVDIGTRQTLMLAGTRLDFEVIAFVPDFPTMSGQFLITSLPDLEKRIELGGTFASRREVWLATDPARHAALVDDPLLRDRILSDGQAQLRSLQAEALTQGVTGAFGLNALTLSALSVAGFLLVHTFAAHRRLYEFGVLRAVGASPSQVLGLLAVEGAWVMALGLLAGTGIGYGLAQIMTPFLSLVLSSSIAGTQVVQIVIDWPAIGQGYLVLIGIYALAMLALLLALLRAGVHRALRIGDE